VCRSLQVRMAGRREVDVAVLHPFSAPATSWREGFPETGDSGGAVVIGPPAQEQERFQRLLATLPTTLPGLFAQRVRSSGPREAFRVPGPADAWTSWTWDQCAVVVRELAAGLLTLGIRAEQPVAIASSTRLEWVLTDLAVACAGAVTTTVDAGLPPEDVGRVLADSGARVVVAEDAEQLARVCDHWGQLPDLVAVVVLDEAALGPGSPHVDDRRVLSVARLRDQGRKLLARDPDAVDRAAAAVRPDSLAALLYTSATTGPAKGVRLTHEAWVSAAAANAATGLLTEDDLQYLWAPLSHAFGKALLATQLAIGFSSAICGDPARLVAGMAQVRPTFVAGPPRLFQRIHGRAEAELRLAPTGRQRLARWAFDVGRQVAAARRSGRRPSLLALLALPLADRLVLHRVRQHFGGRVRLLVSSTAPLGEDVAEWFTAAGLPLLEGYGLTETATAVVVGRPGAAGPGTVGRPLPGTALRVAADGRIQLRGPGPRPAYQNDRRQQGRDVDGWLSTGDTGRIDDGCLRLTGRLRDVLTTATGARIAPQNLQERLSALCPFLSHVVVVGEGRPYLAALVTLDADAIATWASSNGLAGQPNAEVVASDQARAMVAECVAQLNASSPPEARVERFAVLPRDLSVADGELTPALVPRRETVERRWAAVVAALYAT
jgi:long-chain acyl-CoA synthetase